MARYGMVIDLKKCAGCHASARPASFRMNCRLTKPGTAWRSRRPASSPRFPRPFGRCSARYRNAPGERDVIVAVERSRVLPGDLQSLRARLLKPGARPVTYALLDLLGESLDEEALFGPLETLWQFDVDLAGRGFYPAVDPLASTSTLSEGAQLEATHLTVQLRARKMLRRYRKLRTLARIRCVEKLPPAELATYNRGERLEAFLAQSLYVAEPFTKVPGDWVGLQDRIDSVRRLLEGAADEMEPASLKNVERLPQ